LFAGDDYSDDDLFAAVKVKPKPRTEKVHDEPKAKGTNCDPDLTIDFLNSYKSRGFMS
jgi:trehalose-6-phosphatase